MAVFSLSGSVEDRPSLLPALLAVVVAIVFWMLAEDARERLPGIDAQINAANRTNKRIEGGSEASRLQASLEHAREKRAAIESRLQTVEDTQLVRAKIVFDLRQKCAATSATACAVRLADDTLLGAAKTGPSAASAPRSTSGGAGNEKTALIDLGVQKARAIITGSFQNQEITDLTKRLNSDPEAYWRINGIVVRGSSFEFDVERHIITSAQGRS